MTQIDRVVEVVEETLKGNMVQLLAKKALPKLDLPKVGVVFVLPIYLYPYLCIQRLILCGAGIPQSRLILRMCAGETEPPRGDHPPLHRVPGRVHLLQDQARAGAPGELRPRRVDREGATCGGRSRGGFRDH